MILFLSKIFILFLINCMCVFVCRYISISAVACGGYKRASGSLEMGSQVSVSCLMWVLATKYGSLARAKCLVAEPWV